MNLKIFRTASTVGMIFLKLFTVSCCKVLAGLSASRSINFFDNSLRPYQLASMKRPWIPDVIIATFAR